MLCSAGAWGLTRAGLWCHARHGSAWGGVGGAGRAAPCVGQTSARDMHIGNCLHAGFKHVLL